MPASRSRLRAVVSNVLLAFLVCILGAAVVAKVFGIAPRDAGRVAGQVFVPLSIVALLVGLVRPGRKGS
jgi:hypothetical protein